jgi:hypothetical protein
VSEQQKPNPGLGYRLLASHESLQAGDDVYKISGWKTNARSLVSTEKEKIEADRSRAAMKRAHCCKHLQGMISVSVSEEVKQ